MTSNENMGMATRFWGSPFWVSIHSVAMGYPVHPTKKQKKEYKIYFECLKNVLPCGLCRDSFKKFLKELPLDDNVLKNRKNLFMWTCKIHNKVNKKLNCAELTKNQMEKKYKFYDSFRASCSKDKLGCRNTIKKNNKKTKIVYVHTKK